MTDETKSFESEVVIDPIGDNYIGMGHFENDGELGDIHDLADIIQIEMGERKETINGLIWGDFDYIKRMQIPIGTVLHPDFNPDNYDKDQLHAMINKAKKSCDVAQEVIAKLEPHLKKTEITTETSPEFHSEP